jgi:hypothetical protein
MARAARRIDTPAPEADFDLGAAETRERLTPAAAKAATRIAEAWALTTPEICALLGGISERSWYRMKKAAPDSMGQDMLTRVSALIGIYKGLRLVFSEPLSSEWVKRRNTNPIFGGANPVEAMARGGIPKMLQVRAYVDTLRGGS